MDRWPGWIVVAVFGALGILLGIGWWAALSALYIAGQGLLALAFLVAGSVGAGAALVVTLWPRRR